MLRALTFLVLVVLAGGLAGCMGGPAAPTPKGDAPTISPAAVEAPPANDTANVTLMPAPVPITYSGTSPTGVCTYGTPADQCQFSAPGTEGFHMVEANRKPTHVAVQITYGAQQPGMEFYATICKGKKGDPSSFNCSDYKTAPSPMLLDVDLRALPADGAIAISLGSLNITPTPAGAMTFSSVDFKVQGTLTVA
jgi:hypothetical protein